MTPCHSGFLQAKVYEHAEENAAEYRQWVQQRQLEIDEEESFDY